MTPEEAERVYCMAAGDAADVFEAAAEKIELEADNDGPARVMVSDLLRAAEEFVRIHHEGPWVKRPRPGRRHDDVPEIPDTADELIRFWRSRP